MCATRGRDVTITEIMPRSWKDQNCPEWFELHNPGADDVDLSSWEVEDPTTGATWRFPEDAVLRAGDAMVLAERVAWYCPTRHRTDLVYGREMIPGVPRPFSLGLYQGGVVLRDAMSRVRDAVVWDRSWGFEVGRSLELRDAALDNALRRNWAPATEAYANARVPANLHGTPQVPPAIDATLHPGGPCDDGNDCTADHCLEKIGCVHLTTTDACDDHDPCTTGDRCEATDGRAVCRGGPSRDCDDGDACTADVCQSGADGGCRHLRADGCDAPAPCAGNPASCPSTPDPCWDWICPTDGSCRLEPVERDCDDGDPCTLSDRCDRGICRGETPPRYIDCGPTVQMYSEGVCVPELGGVAYPVWCFHDAWACTYENEVWCRVGGCPVSEAPCGPVECWELTGHCVVVLR